jgi:hypothetical protein
MRIARWRMCSTSSRGSAARRLRCPFGVAACRARLAQHSDRPVEPDHPRTRRHRAVSDQLVARTASDVQEQCCSCCRSLSEERRERRIGRFVAVRLAIVEWRDHVVVDARRPLHDTVLGQWVRPTLSPAPGGVQPRKAKYLEIGEQHYLGDSSAAIFPLRSPLVPALFRK